LHSHRSPGRSPDTRQASRRRESDDPDSVPIRVFVSSRLPRRPPRACGFFHALLTTLPLPRVSMARDRVEARGVVESGPATPIGRVATAVRRTQRIGTLMPPARRDPPHARAHPGGGGGARPRDRSGRHVNRLGRRRSHRARPAPAPRRGQHARLARPPRRPAGGERARGERDRLHARWSSRKRAA